MKDSGRAMGMRMAALGCALAASLLAANVFSAAPAASKMTWETLGVVELDTEANTVTVIGETQFTYEGERRAEMTCRSARIKLGEQDEIVTMVADGPVRVKMIAKAANAQTITADCDRSATYDQKTDTITMVGNVVATMHQPGEKAKVRDLTLRGDKATLQLGTGKIAFHGSPGKPAAGALTLPEQEPKKPEGEKTPEKETAK